MNADHNKPLVAVDVGNSQIMAGFFLPKIIGEIGNSLPEPHRVLSLQTQDWDPMEWNRWLAPLRPCDVNWCIGSVCDHAADVLQDWLKNESDDLFARILDFRDLLIEIEIPSPASIGIDRLLGAVAANCIRPPDRPAIVIDLGSAITVDVISAQGSFRGGAILPGIQMSGRALHAFTDRLPQISPPQGPPPSPIGRSTEEAISSGIYWGTVGALRILVSEFRAEMSEPPITILTGGNAPLVAEALDGEVRCESHLILAGIATVVDSICQAQRDP